MVGTFLLFALAPLAVFAATSYDRVRDELESASAEQMRGDVTSVAIILNERLMLAADELLRHADGRETVEPFGVLAEVTDVEDERGLGESVRASLAESGVALEIRDGLGGPGVWLHAVGSSNGRLVAGRLEPGVLFNPDGLERDTTTFSVHRRDGSLIHSSGEVAPSAGDLADCGLGSTVRGGLRWGERDDERIGQFWEVFTRPRFGINLVVTVHASRRTVLEPMHAFEREFIFAVLLTIACVLLASLVRIRRIMRPVGALVEATEKIARNDFGVRVPTEGNDEFASLGRAFNAMASDLEHREAVLVSINKFGAALSVESDPSRLIARLVHRSAELFGADGVLVYLADRTEQLDFNHLCIRSLDVDILHPPSHAREFASLDPDSIDASPLRTDAIDEVDHVIARALKSIVDARDYDVRSLLVLPMLDHDRDVVGALALFNPHGADGQPSSFGNEVVKLAQSLAGQATIAVRNGRLRHEFKALFDAMIEVMAVALDEKSPYTGGHCRRVPEIAMMLLKEVHRSVQGPFASVTFDRHEVYEMQVAALLHDCGKVVTPVHVVDKATKLETIYDRIHLIDQRFALVAREAEIRELREAARAAGVNLDAVEQRIADAVATLGEERTFVRASNTGGEFMSAPAVDRVRSIGSSRIWHDLDGEGHRFFTDEEAKNLTIPKGTLNDEERGIINYHMDATIKMLEQLPFPKRMRQVPLIAGSHHERVDGGGYPRGLSGAAFPLQGRILAVADVFEALTACDRPYKKGKTLSEALKIMSFMARDGHLDPDVFETFLDSRLWERYAATSLSAVQRDAVDLAALHEIADAGRTAEVSPTASPTEAAPAPSRG